MAVLCANKIVRNLKRKNQNNPNHQTNNLTGNKEADKNNRQQYQKKQKKKKILQFELQQQRNTKLVNSKQRPLQD